MDIKREDLDAGGIDLDEVINGKRVPPTHPGEILRVDFLIPMAVNVYGLAKAITVSRSRVNDIMLGRRAITADTALRLARYFGSTPEFWVNLQGYYDLEVAKEALRERIAEEVRPRVA